VLQEEAKLFIRACLDRLSDEQTFSLLALPWEDTDLVAWLIRPTLADTVYRGALVKRHHEQGVTTYLLTETLQELRYRILLRLRTTHPGVQYSLRQPSPEHDNVPDRGWSLIE